MSNEGVTFGVVASAADAPGTTDAEIYRSLLNDVEYHAALGYRTMWLIEHHFSDYFPTPSPLILASHIAGPLPRALARHLRDGPALVRAAAPRRRDRHAQPAHRPAASPGNRARDGQSTNTTPSGLTWATAASASRRSTR